MPTSKKDQIIASIRGDITTGRLKPGDPLPTAAALKIEFACSITPVREAINILKATGWVVGAPGIRVFVADDPPAVGK